MNNEEALMTTLFEIRDLLARQVELLEAKQPRSKSSAMRTPARDEVIDYCQSRGDKVDGNVFFDFYEARGWVLNNGRKMKDWKAAVRYWESREEPAHAVEDRLLKGFGEGLGVP